MREHIPAGVQAAFDRLHESAAELDTRIARAHETPLPEAPEKPDPKVVVEYARNNPDAPAALKAVSKAVAEGRTSWEEVLAGGARDVPEVRDLQASALVQFEREMDKHLNEDGAASDDGAAAEDDADGASTPTQAPGAGTARTRSAERSADVESDDDDYFLNQTFLR